MRKSGKPAFTALAGARATPKPWVNVSVRASQEFCGRLPGFSWRAPSTTGVSLPSISYRSMSSTSEKW